jgi:nucleotide-binding universal stress UspA family protein
MISVERILFPVDLSEQSKQAGPYVKAMASRFHAEVAMLHVIEMPVSMYGPPEAAWGLLMSGEQFREDREAEFEVFLADEFGGIPVVRDVAEGDAATQIDCYARTKKIDLIMMPTHGYGTFRRLLLGSVTAKILHDAKCPVWTGVHINEPVAREAGRCRRIVCAVDTNRKDARVIQWAEEFAKQREAEFILVHAIPGAQAGGHVGEGFRDFLFQAAREEMDQLLDEAGLALEVTLHGGKPEHVVHDLVLDRDADLVIIGRGVDHALGRLRSNAYAIIRESPCSVISV